jgi:hypothetical protein
MWIFLNNAMFSIVEPSAADRQRAAKFGNDVLAVRARKRVDIEQVFPGATILALGNRDYPYRAFIDRREVADAIRLCLMRINYSNFKDSVRGPQRKAVYSRVWGVALDLEQEGGVALGVLGGTGVYRPSASSFDYSAPAPVKAKPGTAAGRTGTRPARRPARQSRRGSAISPRE